MYQGLLVTLVESKGQQRVAQAKKGLTPASDSTETPRRTRRGATKTTPDTSVPPPVPETLPKPRRTRRASEEATPGPAKKIPEPEVKADGGLETADLSDAPAAHTASSPFHHSQYGGIRDAIATSHRRAVREKRGARWRRLGVTLAVIIASVLGGVAGASFAVWSLTSEGFVTAGITSPQTVTLNQPDNATAVAQVAAQAMASVVTIEVVGTGTGGSGSGVIIRSDGHIITNAHVVTVGGNEADPRIRVSTTDGRLWPATIVGTDPISDVAVIKIDPDAPLTPIPLGDSDSLNVGDTTIAIGAPLGLANTVTNGIVSALNRSITVGSSDTGEDGPGLFDFDLPFGQSGAVDTISLPVIQTDASINPGNSGGALLNVSGELIGVNVAIASNASDQASAGSIGLGFAIPVNYAIRVAEELITSGEASHGLLGATVTDAAFNEDAVVSGASIDSVVPGGAADRAGIRSGDIVTQFNGLPITNRIDLTAQVRKLPGGTETTVTFVRGSQSYTVKVTLDQL